MPKTLCLIILLLPAVVAQPQVPTPLWSRGYSIIPAPKNVTLGRDDLALDTSWVVDTGKRGSAEIAVRSLLRGFRDFHALELRTASGGNSVIRLAVVPGSVVTHAGAEIDRQAYRIRLAPQRIEITGNTDTGLFYGVQSLIQLARRDAHGKLVVPEGEIEDWPTFPLRFLHWDTKHHQDRMDTLKRYLDWAALLKVNMIGFELEDKFEYPSYPIIGAPGAFTTQQLQEIVDYGLERHIQVVPQIQSPAHMAYVLKHPEFSQLRSDGNNYQACLCDERTYKLIFSMYDDVIRATKGVDYFFVSTDEVYYAGIDKRCGKPYNPVNRSLMWVEFVQRAHNFLSKRSRKMLIWGEYPLLAEHVNLLPPDIVNGVSSPEYLATENKLGIRQLIYNSMQGAERLFPNHLALETDYLNLDGDEGFAEGRLAETFRNITSGAVRRNGRPVGVYGAAWDDSGLHDETFWLGWSAIAQYGWSDGRPSVDQHVAEFMRLYYGPKVTNMIEIYRNLQRQARAWQATWERVRSRVRGQGYAHWDGRKGVGDAIRWDLVLDPPALPALPDLKLKPSFTEKYHHFLNIARARTLENDQLSLPLQSNMRLASRNRYNLEVLLAINKFIGHHWQLLEGLASAEQSLEEAQAASAKQNHAVAVGELVAAYAKIDALVKEGEKTFQELVAVYEKSRYPKGQSVGGRSFVHIMDDTKDHWADRTADMGFMMQPEREIGLDAYLKDLRKILETYAQQHSVPVDRLGEVRLED